MKRSASQIVRLAIVVISCYAPTLSLIADDRAAEVDSPALRHFETKVRPLLDRQCFACHSRTAKSLKGGLQLDHRAGLMAGGDSGPVVVPGNVDDSRLIQAVRYSDPQLRMPPSKRLPESDLLILEEWVKNGPVFPESTSNTDAATKAHWSLIHPVLPGIPATSDSSWAQNAIDQFVLSKLEADHRRPTSIADKYTLIRRVTYDLTGLPATADEIDAFLNDDSPAAYAAIVDRLLASPRYGERWGRHWLDLVRYADDFDEAWRYRDWVIRSANQDLSYDRFIVQQIAGDQLPPEAGDAVHTDGIIATTMLSIGPWGGIDRKKRLADIVDDQIDIIGRSFLGLTLACARCHDHKFDPITAEDYYALAGFFYSSRVISDEGYLSHGTKRLRIPLASTDEVRRHSEQQSEIRRLESILNNRVDEYYSEFARSLLPHTADYLQAAYDFEFWPKDQPKPELKDFAASRALHPFAIERWIEYLKQPPLSDFHLFNQAVADYDDEQGVHIWRSHAERPWWGVNTNEYDVPIETFNLPPRTVSVYPSVDGGAVAWKSPIQGRVRLTGHLVDADPLDGVGVAWLVDLVSAGRRQELATGAMPATGLMSLHEGLRGDQLSVIEVQLGDSIEFGAWLSRGDAHYDVTNVEFEITDLERGTVWNLNRDVMPNLHQGNPHQDSLGHNDVWSFHDMADSRRKMRMPTIDRLLPADKSLSLAAAASQPDRDAFAQAAAQLQSAINFSDLNSPLLRDLTGVRSPFWVRQRDNAKYLTADAQSAIESKKAEIGRVKSDLIPIAYANGIQEGGLRFSSFPRIQDARMHLSGNPEQLGEPVARRFPNALVTGHPQTDFAGSGRRELASWIASPENPLVARVIVNRIWRQLFGEGIVRTPSNFGRLGEPPTHPELLDWLAQRFIASGWSIKDLTRLMVLSATYQQSSNPALDEANIDPDNLLFGRRNRRRLEAEEVSDSLLAVCDQLDQRLGGPAEDRSRPRRMVYLKSLRSDKSNFGVLFDAADPSMHVEKRTSTTVAPQALEFMNGPLMQDVSAALVRGTATAMADDHAPRIQLLYRTVYGRDATSAEQAIGRDFLAKMGAALDVETGRQGDGVQDARDDKKDNKRADRLKPGLQRDDRVWGAYAQVLLLSNQFLYVD